MPVVIAVQTNFIRINHVVIIPHRKFLVCHSINLLLRKTSALKLQPSFILQPSYFSHQTSAIRLQPSYISPHTSALIPQPSSFSHHTSAIFQPSFLKLQPSYISLHTSAIFPIFQVTCNRGFSITILNSLCKRIEI